MPQGVTVSSHSTTVTTTATATSGGGSSRCLSLNIDYAMTPLGLLQIAVAVLNVICMGVIGYASTISQSGKNYWFIGGPSFAIFFLMVVFMALIISALIVITSLTSFGTATLLPKTSLFVAYHIVVTFFYLCASIALLAEASDSITIGRSTSSKNYHMAAGGMGILTSLVYGALTAFSVLHYMRS